MATVQFDIEYTTPRNRLSNALRIIYAIPHLIIVGALGYASAAAGLVQWFIILFTGVQPKGMFDFLAKMYRFSARLNAYGTLLTDTYPKYE